MLELTETRDGAAAPSTNFSPGATVSLRPTLLIVCHSYFDMEGLHPEIGGVETYVGCLASLAVRHGWSVAILQRGRIELERRIAPSTRLILWKTPCELIRQLDRHFCATPCLVIYSDFGVVPRRLHHPSILLQHGVGWDTWHYERLRSGLREVGGVLPRLLRLRLLRRIRTISSQTDTVVCVDTNFINFLRAAYPRHDWNAQLCYVPNFAALPAESSALAKWGDSAGPLRCIFPRRFAPLRGAVVFAEIVRDLAAKYSHVTFAFVGRGICEDEMRSLLSGLPNVDIYSRPYEEMPAEYSKAHIAVIPTLAAEGTSLSCIEAMAAGCAVLATNVGGLCNLILPDVTGLLCAPTKADLTHSLVRLLDDPALARRLGATARMAAVRGFSKALWEERLWAVLRETARRYGIVSPDAESQ